MWIFYSPDVLGSLETDLTAQFGDNCATLKDSALAYLINLREDYCTVAIPPPSDSCCVACVYDCLSALGTVGGIAPTPSGVCG